MNKPLSSSLSGLEFWKMTGSGNDFVFFDSRSVDIAIVTQPEAIMAICNRHNGIGADGIVVLEPAAAGADARIHYFNSDGTAADLCGNATLCSTALSVTLGFASGEALSLATPAGLITARIKNGVPEFDLGHAGVSELEGSISLIGGETRAGFVLAGIPHLVVLCDDVAEIDVTERGPVLRRHPATGKSGANVNWVSQSGGDLWHYRTFERGVEGETLACGTGAIATAVQLVEWGLKESPVRIRTCSERELLVRLEPAAGGGWRPSLRGEGRMVFAGTILALD